MNPPPRANPSEIFPGVSTRSVPRFEVTADARPRRRARVAASRPPPTRAIGARSFPPPFPTVSQPPRAFARASPRPAPRTDEIPRARRVGFRCRTSSTSRSRAFARRAPRFGRVLRRERPRFVRAFDRRAKSRARIARSERGARGVAECRFAARALRLGRRAVAAAARAPSTRAEPREMDRAVESRLAVRGGGRRARREDSARDEDLDFSRRVAVGSPLDGVFGGR